MNEPTRHALLDALDLLLGLARDRVQPDNARELLQTLRRRHPELAIDLLSEVEDYDQSVHYDVLIRYAGEGTASISYSPEHSLPWPLRGVHRWSDADLVRVNDTLLQVDQAIAMLDFLWEDTRLIERLLNTCLVQEELARAPIELSDDELQRSMNEFRVGRKLYSAADTHAWIQRRGMTQERLEKYVHDNALASRLRDRLTTDHVEDYFNEHRAEFDRVAVARFGSASGNQTGGIAAQIVPDALNFYALAESSFREEVQQGRPPLMGMFTTIARRDAEGALREALFSASPGQVLGPIALAGRFEVMKVIAIVPARLDDATRETIRELLFAEWLEGRRRSARIEWCWGNANTTG